MLDRSDILWQQQNQRQNYQYTPEYATQQHAMAMDRLDRENAMSQINQLRDLLTSGSGMGTSGVSGMGMEGMENRLSSLLDDPDSIKQTGAYKFRVGQGQEALQRSLGAKGLLGSGNRLTELTKYGQDMGSQEYENQFSRLQKLLGGYQDSQSRAYGSLASALGSGRAIGAGGTGDIWSAYGGNRNAQIGAQSALDRQNNQKWGYSDKGGFSWGAA
jgi:hypothetical protein